MAWWYRTWMYGIMVQVMNVTSVNKISPKQTNDRLSSWRLINTAAGEKDVKITWTSRQDLDRTTTTNTLLADHVITCCARTLRWPTEKEPFLLDYVPRIRSCGPFDTTRDDAGNRAERERNSWKGYYFLPAASAAVAFSCLSGSEVQWQERAPGSGSMHWQEFLEGLSPILAEGCLKKSGSRGNSLWNQSQS